MWPDTVISILPSPKLGVQFGDIPWHLIDLIEFLGMSPMGSLNKPIELWTLRRQNKEPRIQIGLSIENIFPYCYCPLFRGMGKEEKELFILEEGKAS